MKAEVSRRTPERARSKRAVLSLPNYPFYGLRAGCRTWLPRFRSSSLESEGEAGEREVGESLASSLENGPLDGMELII
jgi:hypothetical protein